jgi:hypothetical protein
MFVVLILSKTGYGRTGLVSHGGSPVIPLVYFKKHNSEPLTWFPFWQIRSSPFLYHNPPLVIQNFKLTYKKKIMHTIKV